MPPKTTPISDLQTLLPGHSLIEDLFQNPPLRELLFFNLLEIGVKLLFIIATFFVLNWVLRLVIRRTGENIAKRREAHTHPTQAARVRTLTSLSESALF